MQMFKHITVRAKLAGLMLLSAPGAVFAAAGDPIPMGSTDISTFFDEFCNISNWIFAFALVAAVIAIIFSGVAFFTSGGDASKVAQARKFLTWALVGVAIAILAKALVAVIGSFVGVQGITAFLCN